MPMTKNNELMVEAEFLSHLKDNKAKVEAELKEIKSQIDKQELKLVEMMTEQELQNFKGSNGVTYSLKTTVIPNVLADNRPALIDALKKNGFESLVKEEVNAQTFKSFVKEQGWETNEELPAYLQGIVTLYEKTGIGTRRS
jgi:hypothetical protein